VASDREKLARQFEKTLEHRYSRLPYHLPNAGSVFRAPASGPKVGEMMEALNMKGFRVGDAMISTLHGGFIVNVGNATGSDILDVASTMLHVAKNKYGIALEMEQVVI
jgi:UDP-N-acetylmuramate dehydrogenase